MLIRKSVENFGSDSDRKQHMSISCNNVLQVVPLSSQSCGLHSLLLQHRYVQLLLITISNLLAYCSILSRRMKREDLGMLIIMLIAGQESISLQAIAGFHCHTIKK